MRNESLLLFPFKVSVHFPFFVSRLLLCSHILSFTMVFVPIFIALLSQFGFTNALTVDKYGISLQDKMERMERMLLAGTNVEVSVNPCSFFRTGNPNSGEQTAAEWVRIVFHDAITADLAAGTGLVFAILILET